MKTLLRFGPYRCSLHGGDFLPGERHVAMAAMGRRYHTFGRAGFLPAPELSSRAAAI